VPLAWIAAQADRDGYMPWEKIVLGASFVLPLMVRAVAIRANVPIAPFVVAALLAVVLRRARAALAPGLIA
jgi:hypothetical protein